MGKLARRLAMGLLAVGLALAAPALAQEPPSMNRTAAYARLDALFETFARERHAPGLVYGVVVDGRLDHVKAFGVQDLESRRPVDADSVFRIASMTKNFTALSILGLRDEGKLSLEAPVETLVPQFRAVRHPGDAPPVRIRDLVHHTGGFVTDDPWGDRQLDMDAAAFDALIGGGLPFSRATGAGFEYSNFGYAVLGRVIEAASGQAYPDYVRHKLLAPLGMAAATFEVETIPADRRALGYAWIEDALVEQPMLGHGAFGSMGGLAVSANDYAKYVAWLLAAWPPRAEPETGPLTRATVREMAMGYGPPQRRPVDNDGCEDAAVYGAGTIVMNDCVLGTYLTHSGGLPGYGSNVLLMPDRGVAIFAFANVTYAPASLVVREAALELDRAGVIPVRALPATPELERAREAVLAAYAAGNIEAAPDAWAMNFRLDREAYLWNAELQRLRAELGACADAGPLTAQSAMSGTFTLRCERGELDASLTLAPTTPQAIQRLKLTRAED